MSFEKAEVPRKREALHFDQIRAIIFDMDDLMINSHSKHIGIFGKILSQHDVDFKDLMRVFTKEEEGNLIGRKVIEGCDFLREKYNLQITAKELNRQFNEMVIPEYEKGIEAMPYAVDLVRLCKKHGYKMALASSSKRIKIDLVLKMLNLERIFDVIVSGEDQIKHGKPAPDIFLEAAKQLGENPGRCLVLEDAKNGVEAGKAAGMMVIGVHNRFTLERLGKKQDLRAADFQAEDLGQVRDILKGCR